MTDDREERLDALWDRLEQLSEPYGEGVREIEFADTCRRLRATIALYHDATDHFSGELRLAAGIAQLLTDVAEDAERFLRDSPEYPPDLLEAPPEGQPTRWRRQAS